MDAIDRRDLVDARIDVLDHGYVQVIETWGSDARIVEAARMSTDKGFRGWGPLVCERCANSEQPGTITVKQASGWLGDGKGEARETMMQCDRCWGTEQTPGDEKLLQYLYEHQHHTPFEMAGAIIEVQAPIFVFREWQRHRTQSYNELSARYTPLPDVNYVPSRARIIEGAKATSNKQASGIVPLALFEIDPWLANLDQLYLQIEAHYQKGLAIGVPKEIARVGVPVGRYSRMRASANLRNWFHFLTLRTAPAAQWEIRQFADAVLTLLAPCFPRSTGLFKREMKG